MTQPNILELARQGDARAITSLLNRSLQPKGITAKAAKREGILHVLLEGETPPSEVASTKCIRQGLQKLGFVDTPVTIYGREQGSAEVCWQSHLDAPLTEDFAPPVTMVPPISPQAAPAGTMDNPAMDGAAEARESASGGNATATWNDLDLGSTSQDDPEVIAPPLETAYGVTDAGAPWDGGLGDGFAVESPDEPTLIVPPQPEDELDNALQDEDSDSEILLSLWDDADIDEDDLVEPSGDAGGKEVDLWQDGGTGDRTSGSDELLQESPGLIGEPEAKRSGSSAVLPLILLALLGVLGGAAAASRLGVLRLPWLANIPGVGRLLMPPEGTSGAVSPLGSDRPSTTPANESSSGSETPDSPQATDSTATGGDGDGDEVTPPLDQTAQATPFRDAVNAATKAATLAQIAQSPEDWTTVAEHWSDAVAGMKAVSADHPRYELAQTKVGEYQKNLDYARKLGATP